MLQRPRGARCPEKDDKFEYIFGSEASKEMGLVDASSTAGFDSLLGRREKCRQETVSTGE